MKLPEGLTVLTAEISDYNPTTLAMLSEAQRAEIEEIKLLKRKVERTLSYHLINRLTNTFPLLEHTAEGAPTLGAADMPFISLSHSRKTVALLSSRHGGIGIDVEGPTEKLCDIADRFVDTAELASFGGETLNLLRLWTIKEAVYKAANIQGLPLIGGIKARRIDAERSEIVVVDNGNIMHFTALSRTLSNGDVLTIAF